MLSSIDQQFSDYLSSTIELRFIEHTDGSFKGFRFLLFTKGGAGSGVGKHVMLAASSLLKEEENQRSAPHKYPESTNKYKTFPK
ncbi:MAG TPA: hypothetical protein VMR70_18960 [Flavisolibacter sp.]|nr:hypothetical protein [Flavisolibacter sp.]